MSEMEMQLNRLFTIAVGDPPSSVTVEAVRRAAARRRLMTYVTATAAVGIAASIALAVAANATSPRHAVDAALRASEPRYYFEEGIPSIRSRRLQVVIRSTATGSITATSATIHCPGAKWDVSAASTADHQVFFIACERFVPSGKVLIGTRIFRFVVTKSGRVRDFRPIRGGNLDGRRVVPMAISAGGTELAVGTAPAKSGAVSEILVINTRTGARATWHAAELVGGLRFQAYDVSFADNGRVLAVLGFTSCTKRLAATRCKSPGEEMLAVNDASAGGQLASGRTIFTQAQLISPRLGDVDSAFISPNGTTAVATVARYINRHSDFIVYQISAATGKPLRRLYHAPGFTVVVSPDPSGHFLLVDAATVPTKNYKQQLVNGWIDRGKLRPLKPVHFIVYVEAW